MDVIGHSMGGNMARTLINHIMFVPLESSTFGAGYIDKLITIGTPHQGSVPASRMLQVNNSCVRFMLAMGGNAAISTATVNGVPGVHGAMLDLQPGSEALGRMQTGPGPLVPTGVIAGATSASNLASLDSPLSGAGVLRGICQGDYLAQNLTSSTWNSVFGGEANDAIVPVSSQLAGFTGSPVTGAIHTTALAGVVGLGFTGPAELDPASSIPGIQALVLVFLNASPQGPDFHPLR